MSNVSSLRYIASVISILCCLILPWTVQWVSIESVQMPNPKYTSIYNTNPVAAAQLRNKQPPVPNNMNRQLFLLYNENKPNLKEYQLFRNDIIPSTRSSLANVYAQPNRTKRAQTRPSRFLTTTIKIKQLDLKQVCKKSNSTTNPTSLTYYFFELHVLLFYLSILSCSCFIQLYFHFKLVMMSASVCIYLLALNFNKIYECLRESIEFNLPLLKAELLIQMMFFIVFLHLIDRRVY